jgi:hypothetical protein
MSMGSHLHHLFNAETCQAYIHALRWKDRPLQCPRCQSHHVGPWGTSHDQPGLQPLSRAGLQAHLPCPHGHPLGRQQALPRPLDARHLSPLSGVLVAAHCPRAGRP